MLWVLNIWNLVTAILYLALLDSRLRNIREKRQEHIVFAFVVAGFISLIIVFVLYEAYPPGLEAVLSRSELLFHIFNVGVVEETSKFLAFLLILHSAGGIREPQDGVIYGAVVGLTFGAVENGAYFLWYPEWSIAIRPILTTPGHAIYGAIWGGLYSQAVYANLGERDTGARWNAALGAPLVAMIHGTYNAATRFLPAAILIKVFGLIVAIILYRKLVELSPYRVYPLEQARRAVTSIRRGLFFNPWSPTLNRNIGIYLMRLGRFRSAAEHFRRSVPRSRDPRRARFLAAACETTFLPRVHADRALRVAWARLSDEQRPAVFSQLRTIVGAEHEIAQNVDEFVERAFKPRRYEKTSEIARRAKINRMERKRRASEAARIRGRLNRSVRP